MTTPIIRVEQNEDGTWDTILDLRYDDASRASMLLPGWPVRDGPFATEDQALQYGRVQGEVLAVSGVTPLSLRRPAPIHGLEDAPTRTQELPR